MMLRNICTSLRREQYVGFLFFFSILFLIIKKCSAQEESWHSLVFFSSSVHTLLFPFSMFILASNDEEGGGKRVLGIFVSIIHVFYHDLAHVACCTVDVNSLSQREIQKKSPPNNKCCNITPETPICF